MPTNALIDFASETLRLLSEAREHLERALPVATSVTRRDIRLAERALDELMKRASAVIDAGELARK